MIHDETSSVFNLLVQYQFSARRLWHFSFQALYCPSVAVWLITERVLLKWGAPEEACPFSLVPIPLLIPSCATDTH